MGLVTRRSAVPELVWARGGALNRQQSQDFGVSLGWDRCLKMKYKDAICFNKTGLKCRACGIAIASR